MGADGVYTDVLKREMTRMHLKMDDFFEKTNVILVNIQKDINSLRTTTANRDQASDNEAPSILVSAQKKKKQHTEEKNKTCNQAADDEALLTLGSAQIKNKPNTNNRESNQKRSEVSLEHPPSAQLQHGSRMSPNNPAQYTKGNTCNQEFDNEEPSTLGSAQIKKKQNTDENNQDKEALSTPGSAQIKKKPNTNNRHSNQKESEFSLEHPPSAPLQHDRRKLPNNTAQYSKASTCNQAFDNEIKKKRNTDQKSKTCNSASNNEALSSSASAHIKKKPTTNHHAAGKKKNALPLRKNIKRKTLMTTKVGSDVHNSFTRKPLAQTSLMEEAKPHSNFSKMNEFEPQLKKAKQIPNVVCLDSTSSEGESNHSLPDPNHSLPHPFLNEFKKARTNLSRGAANKPRYTTSPSPELSQSSHNKKDSESCQSDEDSKADSSQSSNSSSDGSRDSVKLVVCNMTNLSDNMCSLQEQLLFYRNTYPFKNAEPNTIPIDRRKYISTLSNLFETKLQLLREVLGVDKDVYNKLYVKKMFKIYAEKVANLTEDIPDGSSKEDLQHLPYLASACYKKVGSLQKWNKPHCSAVFRLFCETIHRFTPWLYHPIGTLAHAFDNTILPAPFKRQMCPCNPKYISKSSCLKDIHATRKRTINVLTKQIVANRTGTCDQIFDDEIQLMDHLTSNADDCIYHHFLHLFYANMLESFKQQTDR